MAATPPTAPTRTTALSIAALLTVGCGANGMLGSAELPPEPAANVPDVIAAPPPSTKPLPPPTRHAAGATLERRWPDSVAADPPPPPIDEDLLSHLPTGDPQLAAVCGRNIDNAVTRAFCTSPKPTIQSLTDLQRVLGLEFADTERGNGSRGNPSFAITGHSSSLVTRSVSALNPRTIVFTRNRNVRDDEAIVALGFTRGDQLAEIVTIPPGGEPTFYLLRFLLPCDDSPDGCSWGDKLTPATESGWASWTLYQDEDLKNSVLDCLQCHQPDGPGTTKILRMQELRNPWTHWFRDNRDGGRALISDFQAAHGTDEDYGGIPAALISESDPARLEDLIEDAGFEDQPNLFITDDIEDEVQDTNRQQPDVNMPPGESATWQGLYREAVEGRAIPPPYHDVKVTDPALRAEMTLAYRAVMDGSMPKSSLPDIRDVFLESALPELSMRPAPGLDGRGIMIHMCGQCHNSRLDQTITRARFNAIDLDTMSREAKDEAIRRLELPRKDRFAMPPVFFRDLSAEETARVVEELRK